MDLGNSWRIAPQTDAQGLNKKQCSHVILTPRPACERTVSPRAPLVFARLFQTIMSVNRFRPIMSGPLCPRSQYIRRIYVRGPIMSAGPLCPQAHYVRLIMSAGPLRLAHYVRGPLCPGHYVHGPIMSGPLYPRVHYVRPIMSTGPLCPAHYVRLCLSGVSLAFSQGACGNARNRTDVRYSRAWSFFVCCVPGCRVLYQFLTGKHQ